MLTLYMKPRKKPLARMTYDELVSHYDISKKIQENMARNDIIQYIRGNTLRINRIFQDVVIKTVCIKTLSSCIYLDILFRGIDSHKDIVFEKVKQYSFEESYEYQYQKDKGKIWLNYNELAGSWLCRTKTGRYERPHDDFIILLNHLRKISVFLETREWYIKLYLLNNYLISDIIKYIGFILIDYYQLYNIVVK